MNISQRFKPDSAAIIAEITESIAIVRFNQAPERNPVGQEIVGKPNLSIVVLFSFTPCFSWVAGQA
jgi:hypothetical protein